MTLTELATWLRGFAVNAQAPAGQPNAVAENVLEAAVLIEAYVDMLDGEARKQKLQLATTNHNDMLVTRCTERRADVAAPCGGSKGVRCPDCPRTLGLTAAKRTIAG